MAVIILPAGTARAEVDSCNISFVSTWEVPTGRFGYIGMRDTVLYCTNEDRLYLLTTSDSGELTLYDSLPQNRLRAAFVLDTLLIAVTRRGDYAFIYNIANPLEPDSLTNIPEVGWYNENYTLKDTVAYFPFDGFYSFADFDSVYRLTTRAPAAYLDMDNMFGYRGYNIEHGSEPYEYYEPAFRIYQFLSYDSSVIVLDTNFWGVREGGTIPAPAVNDTFLFIFGSDEAWGGISVCTVNPERTIINHHSTFSTYSGVSEMQIINDTLLYFSGGRSFTICRIHYDATPPYLEMLGKYHHSTWAESYRGFVVKDEFIYVIQGRSGIGIPLAVTTLRFNADSLNHPDSALIS